MILGISSKCPENETPFDRHRYFLAGTPARILPTPSRQLVMTPYSSNEGLSASSNEGLSASSNEGLSALVRGVRRQCPR